MSERRKIKKITIAMQGRGDKVYDIENGDELPEALFFGDNGVSDILIPFYKINTQHEVRKGDVKAEWGQNITDTIFGKDAPDDTTKKITEELINTLWNTEDDDGLLIAVIRKKPQCPLE